MRRLIVSGAIALAAFSAGAGAIALAAGTEVPLPKRQWHFQGPFGTYDRAAAQRGYQVYAEVCAACHSLSLLAYRNLMELGLTDTQVKGLIKDIVVPDLNDDGQPIERPARLSDRFRKPFPNELAAAAANNGKAPPDLSRFVISPMPGLLVEVSVQPGQKVQAGERVAVIEAMKMENVLFAAQDGVVKKVVAAKGESLTVDQMIVEFE